MTASGAEPTTVRCTFDDGIVPKAATGLLLPGGSMNFWSMPRRVGHLPDSVSRVGLVMTRRSLRSRAPRLQRRSPDTAPCRPQSGNCTHCVEGTWGAQIVDELQPQDGEHLIAKKGFGASRIRPWIRSSEIWVTMCVVSEVTTCVCVSTTVRGGLECNYRMILVSDAV